MKPQLFDRIAVDYDGYFPPHWVAEDEVCKTRIRIRYPILDACCGTGAEIKLFDLPPRKGDSGYIGFDYEPGMLEQARRKYPRHTFLELSVEAAELGKYPTVLFMHAADYVTEYELEAFFRRHLAWGGEGYFTLVGKNRDWDSPTAREDQAWPERMTGRAREHFSWLGMRVETFKINPWNRFPKPWRAWMVRRLPKVQFLNVMDYAFTLYTVTWQKR